MPSSTEYRINIMNIYMCSRESASNVRHVMKWIPSGDFGVSKNLCPPICHPKRNARRFYFSLIRRCFADWNDEPTTVCVSIILFVFIWWQSLLVSWLLTSKHATVSLFPWLCAASSSRKATNSIKDQFFLYAPMWNALFLDPFKRYPCLNSCNLLTFCCAVNFKRKYLHTGVCVFVTPPCDINIIQRNSTEMLCLFIFYSKHWNFPFKFGAKLNFCSRLCQSHSVRS